MPRRILTGDSHAEILANLATPCGLAQFWPEEEQDRAVNMIKGWKRRDAIPISHWRKVMLIAKRLGYHLTREKLLDTHPEWTEGEVA